ncbi:MAG: hypothetical protein CME04_07820 [Gemmatimonadaceae bacterium]|nr:hypothetical protein [Gemmatimonadaceae bacterium]
MPEETSASPTESPLLNYSEAADYLSVSKRTLYAMVSTSRIPTIRMGAGPNGRGLTRFRRHDLEAFVQANVA